MNTLRIEPMLAMLGWSVKDEEASVPALIKYRQFTIRKPMDARNKIRKLINEIGVTYVQKIELVIPQTVKSKIHSITFELITDYLESLSKKEGLIFEKETKL